MIPKQPKRRVVDASNTIEMVKLESREEDAPRVARPINERARLERLLRSTDLAITPLERKLERGVDLSETEQRMLNMHVNTSMKLEAALSSLDARQKFEKESLAGLAKRMKEKGMTDEQIISYVGGSPEVLAALEEE